MLSYQKINALANPKTLSNSQITYNNAVLQLEFFKITIPEQSSQDPSHQPRYHLVYYYTKKASTANQPTKYNTHVIKILTCYNK